MYFSPIEHAFVLMVCYRIGQSSTTEQIQFARSGRE